MFNSYFVDPVVGDDDGNDGLSKQKPFRTIAHASEHLRPGDRLRLHAGAVFGPTTGFSASIEGTPEAPIVVEPYAGNRVVLDGRITEPTDEVPNTVWERVAGGHPEEWRTRQILDEPLRNRLQARVRYGAFADSRIRLITYSRLEDLRATNESFVSVPLSDPRPAGGPLEDDPTRKRPWCYLGPGLYWVFENPADELDRRGRVHVRLSRTHLNAPGTADYAGPTDPNQVALALSAEGRVAVVVSASNVRFHNLVIAGGGTTTLTIAENARNVTFDHCTVHGGRFGVRISGQANGVTFEHCTFDGALAPWTVRADVKSSYTFIDPVLGPTSAGLGTETHDILVISHAADNVKLAYCTFRQAHDALQLGGDNVAVHHCLFEDINDEVVQFHAPSNAHIHHNLIRQALNVISFALEDGGGPIYVYRNVIDQRLPTRGYRVLVPDAPAPHIWRYGASYKNGHPMPDVFVYQNTFIASHRDDKGSALSLLFVRGDLSPDARRVHLNNLLVGLNLDLPYSWAMPTSANRRSQGNLWHAPHRDDAPLFRFQRQDGSDEPVETVAELRQLDADWERGSLFAEPGLANFDDEFFEHGRYLGEPYPNNDFRPAAGSPAIGAGVVLPPDLPDPDRPAGDDAPDIGALPATGPPLRVGVDEAVVLPTPGIPVAHAGPDQVIVDTDSDGFEFVTVNGAASVDPGGTITAHAWSEGQVTLASQAVATLYLPEGDHYLRLTVTDNTGATDTDGLRVRIAPPLPHGANLLHSPGFEEPLSGWEITRASVVTSPVHTGQCALRMEPQQQSVVRQRIAVSPEARYRISTWVRRTASTPEPVVVRAVFTDVSDVPVQTTDLTFAASTQYAHHEGTAATAVSAVAMDLLLGADLIGGPAFFDDVRILDANLLSNGGFETPAATGQDDEAPGWSFEAGGARVITELANVRGGARAVALEGIPTDYRQITQQIRDLTGAPRYRVSAWLKTTGLSAPPTISARFDTGGNQMVARTTSEGAYRYVSAVLTAPTGAQRLTVRIRLDRDSTGIAYFDDLLVEPLA
jgi:hypothetical protein